MARTTFVVLPLALTLGCGAAPPVPERPSPPTPPVATFVPPAAKAKFDEGLKALVAHDRAGDWTPDACRRTAALFVEAAGLTDGAPAAKARFDAALAHQRCGDDAAALPELAAALRADPKCHAARAELALHAFRASGETALDAAIDELQRAALDSDFQNVDALVNLATLQMRRRGEARDAEGDNDRERAKKNLHRALAIDDAFLPAYDRLAIYHLEAARRTARGGAIDRVSSTLVDAAAAAHPSGKPDTQALELAGLICSQAIRRDPSWAPIHNTAGLVQVELGNLAAAVAEFNVARKLDPRLFEAHMNAAAVNLSFRGFGEAERAYRAAVGLHPNDYEAHLGLALALRGQIDASNAERTIAAAQAELDRAKRLAPNRAETYYNEAILRQEYKARFAGPRALAELGEAKQLFARFVEKAGATAEYADAVKRSRERMGEIDEMVRFVP